MLCTLVQPALAAEILAVMSSDAAPYAAAAEALRDRMGPGHTLRIAKDGELASVPAETTIVAIGGPAAARCMQELSAERQFFYCMVSDPEAVGLHTDTRSRGITTQIPASTQLRFASELLPRARRIGTLFDSRSAASTASTDELRTALEPNQELVLVDVSRHTTIAAAITALVEQRLDLVWTTADSTIYDSNVLRALLLAAIRAKVPVLGFSIPMVKAGALLGTGIDPADQGRQAAELILKKNAPAGPRPPQVRTAVNTLVAGQLNIEIPKSVTSAADYTYPEQPR